jgi:hypothetical protein
MIIKIFSDDEELLISQNWYDDSSDDTNEELFWSAIRSAKSIQERKNLIPEDDD